MKPPECKYEDTEMDLGIYEKPDVGFDDHGLFMLYGGFNYYGTSQGIGYIIDLEFIKRFIKVFDEYTLQNCTKKVWVEHSYYKIHRIISIDGKKEFDIDKWAEECKNKKRHCRKCDAVLKKDEVTVCKKCTDITLDELYTEDDFGENIK